MSEHLGDEAELYPLGVLDDDAARAVERHIAGCDVCAARVADAQLVSASLTSALPAASPAAPLRPRTAAPAAADAARGARSWDLRSLALAAALVIAVAGLAWQTIALGRRTAADDLALATIVHSHFRHLPMTSSEPAPFGAKILYEPDGSWVYVVVDQPAAQLRAVARTAGGELDLGDLNRSAHTQSLLVHPRARIESIELRRDGTTIAHATLAYYPRECAAALPW